MMLDLAHEELSIGLRGWSAIHVKYNKWARKQQRPEWTLKSIETKFKQVCLSINVFLQL